MFIVWSVVRICTSGKSISSNPGSVRVCMNHIYFDIESFSLMARL